ncbi:RNA-directed DNA polymerase from mobile element jockey-like, partial [Brachionus plicatilis]
KLKNFKIISRDDAMSETEQMETAPNNELIQVDFRDGPDSTTTPTRLKEIRENFVNKKSKRKEFDSFPDEDVSILDSKKSKKMDTPALRGKVVGLELDIIKYEKTIEELIEIAESLQKDNEKLSKYMNDQLNHINSKIKQVDEREKSRSKEVEEVKKRIEDLEISRPPQTNNWRNALLNNVNRDKSQISGVDLDLDTSWYSEKQEPKERYDEDKEEIENLFASIKFDKKNIINVRRFKEKNGVSYDPPILVQLATQRIVDIELKALRKSKNEEEEKQNLPFRWCIRGFELRRFKIQEDEDESGPSYRYGSRSNYRTESRRETTQARGRGRGHYNDGDFGNIFDLVITEESRRIYSIERESPLGSLNRAHLSLSWTYELKGNAESAFRSTSFMYKKIFINLTVNEMYVYFLDKYNFACNRFIPIYQSNKKKKFSPWMRRDIKSGLRRKFSAARKEAEKLMKEGVKSYEESIASSAKSNPKEFNRYVNNKSGNGFREVIKALKNSDGVVSNDPKEIADLLNMHFQSIFSRGDSNRRFPIFNHFL